MEVKLEKRLGRCKVCGKLYDYEYAEWACCSDCYKKKLKRQEKEFNS